MHRLVLQASGCAFNPAKAEKMLGRTFEDKFAAGESIPDGPYEGPGLPFGWASLPLSFEELKVSPVQLMILVAGLKDHGATSFVVHFEVEYQEGRKIELEPDFLRSIAHISEHVRAAEVQFAISCVAMKYDPFDPNAPMPYLSKEEGERLLRGTPHHLKATVHVGPEHERINADYSEEVMDFLQQNPAVNIAMLEDAKLIEEEFGDFPFQLKLEIATEALHLVPVGINGRWLALVVAIPKNRWEEAFQIFKRMSERKHGNKDYRPVEGFTVSLRGIRSGDHVP